MDKKLILEAKKVKINLKNDENSDSFEDTLNLISNLDYVLNIFEKISLENLYIGDNHVTIFLDQNQLYVDNKYINISSEINSNNNFINLNINSIYFKDNSLTLFGDVKIDLEKNIASFFGKYIYKYIEGDINTKLSNDIFDFYLSADKQVDSLVFLKDFFRLDKIAEAWMYNNVEGKIKLNYLLGKIDLKNKKPIIDSIKGQAVIDNAKIRFHKDAKTVDTPKLVINYENNTLSFDLEKPMYDQSKLYGSRVFITDLTSLKKGVVHVDLKSDSILNKDILEILNAYKISLPVKQFSGELSSKLLLEIPYLASKEMHAFGEFKAQNAIFRLGSFEFFANKADVVLKDNLVTINKAHVQHKDMLDANLKLTIDTKNKTASGSTDINSFEIKKDDENIFSLKDFNTDISIDFNNNTILNIDKLNTQLNINDESVDINIPELQKIYTYSDLLQKTKINDGKLRVSIIDEKNINFDIDAKNLNFPFEKNGKKIKELNATGVIKNNTTFIKTADSGINIILKENNPTLIKLNDIDIVLSDKELSSSSSYPNIDLELKNSTIVLDKEHKYDTSWLNLSIRNSNIKFNGEVFNLDFPISKNGKKITNLELLGEFKNKHLKLQTIDKKISLDYNLEDEKIKMNVSSYDVIYNTDENSESESTISYDIKGIDSNIIINKEHIAKANSYNFKFQNDSSEIELKHQMTRFYYKKDVDGNIHFDAQNMNDSFLNALLGKKLIEDGNVNLTASGKNDKVTGYANLKGTKIVDLAILNNLIILINTSPAIINPFLAIPSVVGMATNGGFNLNGYRIVEGRVDFTYDFKNKYLNMDHINTKGNGIDFEGNMVIDFLTSTVDAKLKLIFFKDYSKLVGYIPVVNYVLLGEEKRVDTEVVISGTLDEPKYKTNLVNESVNAPVNFMKRLINTPIDLIKSIGNGEDKKEK